MMRRLLVACFACVSATALAQEAPPFDLTVIGEKTWTIRIGLGSAGLLSGEDLSPGQPALTQTLRAEIEGKALGFITLRASFNDQLGPGFQEFLLIADRAPWKGELGRFVVGAEGEGLGVYNKRVLGARASYAGDGIAVGAVLTRLEGISETRAFRGERGLGETVFTVKDLDEPWRTAPYFRAVEGLAYWSLRVPFVEDLSRVNLRVEGSLALWAFLADWGLAFIQEDLSEELVTSLAAGEFLVLRDGGDDLALRVPPSTLARRRVQAAIDAHNTRLGLTGSARKTYPFVAESELETRFLERLSSFLAVLVDEDAYPFPQIQFRRYLALGERDVIEGSVEVWIRLPGEAEFRPAADPALARFTWTLLPAEGVVRISFPTEFFTDGAVRVAFAYRREGSAFMLGLSLVPGSERVYKNGKPLARGTDYTVDYEVGMLILFTPLEPEEELKVDFERQRGGLGVVADYERSLFGLGVSVPGWDSLKIGLYRAMDFGAPVPTTRTMPNAHTVAALAVAGKVNGWSYSLSLAGSENVFPADDNARVPSPNQVNAIASAAAPDGEYTVFGHQNGLTAYKDGTFAGYGAAHGMSGRTVHALLSLPGQLLVGTDAGLTVVRLTEPAPFDRVRSWGRIGKADGVPGTEVLAFARGGGGVYLATEEGLAAFSAGDAEAPKKWEKIALPDGKPRPTALLWRDGQLVLGTREGVFARTEGEWVPVGEAGDRVHALLLRGQEVYVATDNGILVLGGGGGTEWIVVGKTVYDLTLHEGVLWYAAEDGLWREGARSPAVEGRMTAVGGSPSGVWAGGEADEAFRLDLWRVAERAERFPQSRTKIDGRDLARFQDIPAKDHTRYGLTGNLTLSRAFGDWQWEVAASSRVPGYEEIGRSGRSDSHGIAFTARYTGQGPSHLVVSGRWGVADLATRPTGRLTGALDWRWSGGPVLEVSLTPTATGRGAVAFDKLESGWRLRISDKKGALTWGVTTSGTASLSDLSAAGQVGANLSFPAVEGWTVSGSWGRPFRTLGRPGEETIVLTAKGEGEGRGIRWTATVQETLRHSLDTDAWRDERAANLTLRRGTQRIWGTEVTPTFSGSWTTTATEWRWSGQMNADLVQAPVLLRLGVTVGQGFRPATERSDRSLGLSFSWESSQWEGVRPSLRWSRSWTLLSHPRYADQLTEKEEVALRASWEPRGAGWRDTLTATWKRPEGSLSVTNRLSWLLDRGAVSSDSSLTLKGGAIEAKVGVELGLPLDALLAALGSRPLGGAWDAWGLSAEAGYILKLPRAGELTHALFVGATFAVKF